MRIPGVKTATTISRWMRARVLGGALILAYHRVSAVENDEHEICISPEHFAEQMDAVGKYTRPIHLSQLVRHLKDGSVPARSVAVTFDDGYADNLYQARPILEKHGIPATIFVCTGYAGAQFWWDELHTLVLSSKSACSSLRLDIGGTPLLWSERKHLGPDADLHGRRKFGRHLYNLLLRASVEEQARVMHAVRDWSGVSSSETAARSMTCSELMEIAQGGLIRLGAHTRHHPMLPVLSREQQREEIIGSKQDLETLLGEPVDGFAYPNGRASEAAREIVRDAGFLFACTSVEDTVRPGSDLHALTRFWQKDAGRDAFMQGLHWWMKGI